MKLSLTAILTLAIIAAFAQSVSPAQPVEEQYHLNYWWWVLGVLVIIGIGVIIYLLIKKDPRRDAVR